jgi:hypothetical protein
VNPIGFSTGALALGDFRAGLSYLIGKPFTAIELSALRIPELPVLLQEIPKLDLSQFTYIALHAPSAFSTSEEEEVVRLLAEVPSNWRIILHPDTIHDSNIWASFGEQLVLENMDRRKADGRTAAELSRWFSILPRAGFCFDLAHAQQWDPTLTEAYLLLKSFSDRLRQVHISQLDSASRHYPLTESSIRAFSELAWLIPPSVPFIIESRLAQSEMEMEISSVTRIASSAPTGAYQLMPA